MYELIPYAILWSGFVVFLAFQTAAHGYKWANEDYITQREKTVWASVRVLIFTICCLCYVIYSRTPQIEYAFEVIRLLILQLTLFWLLFDISLPFRAGKPQLWQDSTLRDNVSFLDRLSGNWVINLSMKIGTLAATLAWIHFTYVWEFVPGIPNFISVNMLLCAVVATAAGYLTKPLFETP